MRHGEAYLIEYLLFYLLDEGVALVLGELELLLDLVVGDRVEIAHGEILELVLDRLHAEAVGYGGVDLHALERLVAALLILDALDGSHIVNAVGELDDYHADIVAHGYEHLADVLSLALLAVGIFDLADLGQTVDEVYDLLAEIDLYLVEGGVGILDGIVQQSRHDRIGIHAHLGDDAGDGGRVQDERHA